MSNLLKICQGIAAAQFCCSENEIMRDSNHPGTASASWYKHLFVPLDAMAEELLNVEDGEYPPGIEAWHPFSHFEPLHLWEAVDELSECIHSQMTAALERLQSDLVAQGIDLKNLQLAELIRLH